MDLQLEFLFLEFYEFFVSDLAERLGLLESLIAFLAVVVLLNYRFSAFSACVSWRSATGTG
jgi:hypothetical protein